MGDSFRDLLLRYMERRQLNSARKLSTAVAEFYRRAHEPALAQLPPQTIQRWLKPGERGEIRVPHSPLDVVRVAATLGLSKASATRLLLAAGKPSVDALRDTLPPPSLSAEPALSGYDLLRRALHPWAAAAPHNLPADLSSFIGRETELVALADRLTETGVRLVTLTGPGGSGKTRLALQSARLLLDAFADGVYFVALDAVEDPQQVMAAVLRALGLPAGELPTQFERLAHHLEGRRVLLVLDNVEHLSPTVPQLSALLGRVGGLQMLATSRVPLRAYGEHTWPVAPLPLPEGALPPVALRKNPAVALFAARARAVAPGFAVESGNGAAVRGICTLLEGIPLGIELAAARVGDYPPQELLRRYTRAIDIAADGPVDRPARQQSLRQAIAWSYQLLDPEQQRLFRCLAIFRGGLPREAAAIFGEAADEAATGALLDQLVERSLVVAEPGPDQRRYRLLEPIREYAREALGAHAEEDAIARRHLAWCIAVGERLDSPLEGGPESAAWLAAVDRELPNLRAALAWASSNAPALALRLVAAIWPYWVLHQELEEGQRWLGDLLARVPDPGTARAKALCGQGMLNFWNDLPAGYAQLTEALAIAEALGDRQLVAAIRWPLAFVALSLGKIAEVRPHLDAGWPLASLPDRQGLRGVYRMMYGYLADQGGYREIALAELRAALADTTAADQPVFRCMILSRLNGLLVGGGEYEQAREYLATFRDLAERIGAAFYRHLAWYRLGMYHEATADLAAAEEAYRVCLRLAEAAERSRFERAISLLGLGRIALQGGNPGEASRLLESANALAAQLQDQRLIREVSLPLALALWGDDRRVEALHFLGTVLADWVTVAEPSWLASWAEIVATLAIERGDPTPGATWLAALDRARKRGLPQRPAFVRQRVDATLSRATGALGSAASRLAWQTGQQWSREQAQAAVERWLHHARDQDRALDTIAHDPAPGP